MATYIFLVDAVVNGQYIQAGTTQSTVDAGGILPIGWPPIVDVDPVDSVAIWNYWAQGPRQRNLFRQQWVGLPIPNPIYTWVQAANGQWSLGGIVNPPQPPGFLVTESGAILISETGQVLETG